MGNKLSNKPNITQALITKIFFLAIGSIVLVGALWAWSEYSKFQVESESMREISFASHKIILKNEVDKAVSYIEFKKREIDKQLKQSIKDRVYEAHAIASNIFEQSQNNSSQYEIQKMVKDALRPIRFNYGRGYYFAFNLKGVEELFADKPEMEGKDMLAVRNSDGQYVVRNMIEIAEKNGEGFYEYAWTKPNREGYFPKITFLKLFKPFNWVIGAGEYKDDVEQDIQTELITYIEQISFGGDGYVFASCWDGVSLTNPGKGKNNINVTDSNGLKVVQELIKIAKNGSGYFEYVMPKMDGKRPAPKLSYVVGIPKWEWYVGAGIYIDEIETAITGKRQVVKQDIIQNIMKVFIILAGLVFLMVLLSVKMARKSKTNFNLFIDFFRKAVNESVIINPDMMDFAELEILAHSANKMTSARNRAEERLRASEIKLRDTLNTTPFPIAVVDFKDEKIDFWSSSALTLFGHTAPTTSEWYQIAYPDPNYRQEVIDRWKPFLEIAHESGHPVNTGEYRVTCKDGSIRICELYATFLPDNLIVTFNDVTDRKNAEEEIRRLNKDLELRVRQRTTALEETNTELEDFVYSISHDLRAPLRSISGFSEIINRRHKKSLNEEGQHYFNNIVKASSQMGELIDDLLKFSRLGRLSIKSEKVLLNDVFKTAMETLSNEIKKTGAHVTIPEQMPAVQGDLTLITHVFINLMENALKYHKTDIPPVIDVGFEIQAPDVIISVIDNGIGIDPAYHEKIFKIFQRLHSQTEYPGTGIGLAAVKKALQIMEGQVWVESEPDKGSIFKIKILMAKTTSAEWIPQ